MSRFNRPVASRIQDQPPGPGCSRTTVRRLRVVEVLLHDELKGDHGGDGEGDDVAARRGADVVQRCAVGVGGSGSSGDG